MEVVLLGSALGSLGRSLGSSGLGGLSLGLVGLLGADGQGLLGSLLHLFDLFHLLLLDRFLLAILLVLRLLLGLRLLPFLGLVVLRLLTVLFLTVLLGLAIFILLILGLVAVLLFLLVGVLRLSRLIVLRNAVFGVLVALMALTASVTTAFSATVLTALGRASLFVFVFKFVHSLVQFEKELLRVGEDLLFQILLVFVAERRHIFDDRRYVFGLVWKFPSKRGGGEIGTVRFR